MSEKLSHLLTSVQPDSFISQDSIFGWRADPAFGEGKRVGALFFARHLDCFIMTRQFASIYRDLVPSRQFHHDQWVLVHLPGLAKNAAPRHGRQLIKPPAVRCHGIPVKTRELQHD
jgi:hypothetical protein